MLLPILALSCSTLTLPLDDSMRNPETFSDKLTRDTTLFMLEGMIEDPATSVQDGDEAWTVDCNKMQPQIAVEVEQALAWDGTLDAQQVRLVFERHYDETIAERGQAAWIKPTFAEFTEATHFKSWESFVIPRSSIKNKTRHIFRSPEDFLPRLSVSQTLESTTGDTSAPVRETEVGVQRADGKNWDFYVYDAAGQLSPKSTFPAGERPAPQICIACHYSSGSRAVDSFFP